MKRFVCLVCVAVTTVLSQGQTPTIKLQTAKTVSLIFPYSITHVDKGSRDILVLPVGDQDNILLIKAATKDFEATNLSVITSDGSVYALPIEYGEPTHWVYEFSSQKKNSLANYAAAVLDNPSTVHGIKKSRWDVKAQVKGIYIKEDVFYFQLGFENNSPIDYDISVLRFYLEDKKKTKRIARQELELTPLYTAGNTSHLDANTRTDIVIALSKFTIPDQKYLAIEIQEKSGGRNFVLKVGNSRLVKAITLSDVK